MTAKRDPQLKVRLVAEAGRVLSAANEKSLQSCVKMIQTVLDQLAKNDTTEAARTLDDARALIEADMSHDEIRSSIMAELRDGCPQGVYRWVVDVYDDHVVWSEEAPGVETKLWDSTYTIDDQGEVEFGQPAEVRREQTYVPVNEPVGEGEKPVIGDLVPLVEKAVNKDGTIKVKLISPGWGSSGYYSPDLLERDGAKAFPTGTQMFWDHPSISEESDRPERSLRDLAAVLATDATWQTQGDAGPGLYAEAKVFGGYKEALDELAPHIGASIRALGRASYGEADGQKGQIIESLVKGQSVDFVTLPGRGGQVLSLFESARGGLPRSPKKEEPVPPDPTRPTPVTESDRIAKLEQRASRAEEALLLRDARDLAGRLLEAVMLPDVTKNRVIAEAAANPPVTEDGSLDREKFTTHVQEAAKAEAAYLAEAAGAGRVVGMGGGLGAPPNSEQVAAGLKETFASILGSDQLAEVAARGRN